MTADGKGSFPVVMVGGVLGANNKWNIGNEVTNSILKTYPGACVIRPKVSTVLSIWFWVCPVFHDNFEEDAKFI